MEIVDENQLVSEDSCETVHNENTLIEQCQVNVDTNTLCDNHQDPAMKEEILIARSVNMNDAVSNFDEDNNPCVNMSMDNSKEESDFSDYAEDNTRCQLANQAVRAKLLNSVANPANGNDSKLRVSVFDHRIIPKKFIIPKIGETRSSKDIENGNKIFRSLDLNSDNTQDNKRKMSGLSYTVLKASKRYNRENSADKSPTSPSMEADNDVRTRFDILLRNLIEDVDDMKVEPVHVTVSSGYESDYTQNHRETDTKTSQIMHNTHQLEQNKENVFGIQTGLMPLSYSSESGASTLRNASLQGSHGFSSLPALPTQAMETGTGTLQRHGSGNASIVKLSTHDKDSQGFNYAQRHNYKLTKVTRNMYEIIHDLQNGEKTTTDGRKRSKKGRRSSQDHNPAIDGNASAREIRPRGRIQSNNSILDIQSDPSFTKNHLDVNTSSISGSVVRCVRRPLCSDLQSIQRNLPHSESGNRLVISPTNNNCNKVQNDLRNLLCGTADVTVLSTDNNEHQVDFNTSSGGNNALCEFSSTLNGHIDNGFNHANVSINTEPSTTHGQRRPTLNEQFMNRPRPDDHVYETIPGDEKYYEEWKRMRQNPKIPKIRRFTTIPDLPGTFIPKEPPALPERNLKNEPKNKDTDNYIFMGDVNSNFPNKKDLNSGRSDSGYASVVSDQMLDRTQFHAYPYPKHDDAVILLTGRTDETTDGYCSIDNLSLLRENITDKPYPEIPSRDWRIPNTNSLPRLPHEKNNYFLSPVMNREEYKNIQGSSSAVSRGPERHISREFDIDATLMSSAFDEPIKPVFQATYV